MKYLYAAMLLMACALVAPPYTWAKDYYVNQQATANGTGESWASAFTSLQTALDVAQPGDRIFVAQGTYYPTALTNPTNDRSATFAIPSGVSLYGGFAGNELVDDVLDSRNWKAHPTILSGDLAQDDTPIEALEEGSTITRNDNSYHVLTLKDQADTITLDGLVIEGGAGLAHAATYAYSPNSQGGGLYVLRASAVLRHMEIKGNMALFGGAGIYADSATVALEDVAFEWNRMRNPGYVTAEGGGLYALRSQVSLQRASFRHNSASRGGGLFFEASTEALQVKGTTFIANYSNQVGGGLWVSSSGAPGTATIENTTVMGNTGGGGILVQGSGVTLINTVSAFNFHHGTGLPRSNFHSDEHVELRHCAFPEIASSGAGWLPAYGIDGGGNLKVTDPYFADPEAEDYRLALGSACLNAGSPAHGTNIGAYQGEGLPLVPSPRIYLSHDTLDFKKVGHLTTVTLKYRVFARFLPGPLTITSANPAFKIALGSGQVFGQSLTLQPNANGFLPGETATVTLRFAPEAVKDYAVPLNHSSQGIEFAAIAQVGQGALNQRVYVKAGADTTGDGSSWENAFPGVQEALEVASAIGDTVFVAKGLYTEPHNGNFGDNYASYELPDGIRLFGSLAGNEAITANNVAEVLAARDFVGNATVLSADIDQNDGSFDPYNPRTEDSVLRLDNNRYILVTDRAIGPQVIDGFTLEGVGLAGYSSTGCIFLLYSEDVTVANCLFRNNAMNNGVPMHIVYGGSVKVSHCVFENNVTAAVAGGLYAQRVNLALEAVEFRNNKGFSGGLYAWQGHATLTACAFENNTGTRYGGAMTSLAYTLNIANSHFTNNVAPTVGGLVVFPSSTSTFPTPHTSTITNTTFAENYASEVSQALYFREIDMAATNVLVWNEQDTSALPLVAYRDPIASLWKSSLLQGSGGSAQWVDSLGTDGGGNLDVPPMLLDAARNDYRVNASSPVIGAGLQAIGTNIGRYQGPGADVTGLRKQPAIEVNLYPNPAHGRVTLASEGLAGQTLHLALLNTMGQVVRQYPATVNPGAISLEVEGLKPGLYLLKVAAPQGTITRQLLVQ